MADISSKISQAIYDGEADLVVELAEQATSEGLKPNEIIDGGGVDGLERLGVAFNEMEAFLPELMLGGVAMKALLIYLEPLMSGDDKIDAGTVVVGTAQGDLHDIGLNLLATQLAVGGFNVINLGTDVTVKEYIEVAKKNDADIIGISSLMTSSAYYQSELIKRMEKDGIRDQFKVIVGGGPITPQWTKDIKADGYARTAVQAVNLCKQLLDGATEQPIIIE
jgi:5-methyltetrahydrofolate--homocysteine methyltransferase